MNVSREVATSASRQREPREDEPLKSAEKHRDLTQQDDELLTKKSAFFSGH